MKRTMRTFGILGAFALVCMAAACGPVHGDMDDPAVAAEYRQGIQRLEALVDRDAYNQAIEPAYRLMEIQPEDIQLLTLTCLVVTRAGYHEDALVLAEQAYDLDTTNVVSQNNLAYTYSLVDRNLGQAQELIHDALDAFPDHAPFLDTMGWVLYKRGAAEEALPYVEAALDRTWRPWETEISLAHQREIMRALGL